MFVPAETVPDISEILPQRTPIPEFIRFSDMETPRPVTAGPAEFPRSSHASLSLPSFLYGNPRFRVTPSFFRLSCLGPAPPKRRHATNRQASLRLPSRNPFGCAPPSGLV